MTWDATIQRILTAGFIPHSESGSVIARLSFTQTSVFGVVGRSMMAPLYAKLRADPYLPVLSGRETAAVAWWAASLPNMEPRVATPKGDRTERIVYTDAAGKSQIIATVISGPSSFKNTKYIRSIAHIRTGGRWGETFTPTSYIYGLEMLAVLTTLTGKGAELANKSVTFYIDNDNALLAILKTPPSQPLYRQ